MTIVAILSVLAGILFGSVVYVTIRQHFPSSDKYVHHYLEYGISAGLVIALGTFCLLVVILGKELQ